MAFSIIPFLLLAIPLAEIAMFIVIGSQIGVLATLGLILFTAILGSILLRIQGFGILQRINTEARARRVPGRDLIHGVMILVAGVLLLTPGFVTDTLGFLLFVPQIRDLGWRLLKDRVTIVAANMAGQPGGGEGMRRHDGSREPTIELDEDDFQRHANPDSPWTDETRDPGKGKDPR